ncbi:TYRO protein tyrosine kinase-binding protein [Trichomycterus rosablanca]|uniref:TYRO protein tyrosine kinase-binding protein n=1 Tax=Trichomycterus rosablanca TaxID=2290929 RepID=UPI002F35A5DD
MGWTVPLIAVISGLFGSVAATQDCGSCYHLNMGVIIAIVTSDIILTLLITISVYCFASRQKRKSSMRTCTNSSGRGKEKSQRSTIRQKEVEITESPYQELYGVQSDIYNDLCQYQK